MNTETPSSDVLDTLTGLWDEHDAEASDEDTAASKKAEEGEESTDESTDELEGEEQEKDEKEESSQEEDAESATPQDRWPAELKEQFDEWNPEKQEEFLADVAPLQARIDELQSKMTKATQEVAESNGLGAVSDQAGDYLGQFGDEEQQVKTIVTHLRWGAVLHHGSPEQKREMIQNLATHFKVDLGTTTSASENVEDEDDEYTDPETRKLRAENAEFRQRLSSLESSNIATSRAAGAQDIKSFEDATGKDGKLLHGHFSKVSSRMGALMTKDRKLSMEDAYTAACWSNEEVRKELLKATNATTEKDRKERVRKAKNAKPVRKGSTAVTKKETDKTLVQVMSEVHDELSASG